ncbi:MAG: hypothetical protein Q8P23_02350 [bacterium]|nr:hypothetical protein [bacterium]
MNLKPYLAICAGIFVSALLFVPIMEWADTNDYNLFITDPVTGLARYKPNSSFTTAGDCYENTVEISNLGFHGPPVSIEKKKDVFRIVIIGSSYASAIQVPIRDMYSTLLQEKLNAIPHRSYTYEVIPIALGMNRTLLDMFYYLKYGSALKPDIVINIESDYELVAQNAIDTPTFDAQGDIVLQTPKSGESPMVAFLRSVSRHSKFLVNLYNRALIFKSALGSFFASPFSSAIVPIPVTGDERTEEAQQEEDARWQNKEKIVSTYAKLVAEDDARFVFASWTGSWVATSTAKEFPRHMKDIAARNDFYYADLVPVSIASEAVSGRNGKFQCDYHWNQDGNRYAADALYGYLTKHPALLSR